jgi:hypothetical protein
MEAILLLFLPGGLPLGTLMAAVAMISASLIPVVKPNSASFLRRAGWILVLASVLWLPLGIYLSGNAALSFVQDAADAQLFWRFTTGLGVCILIALVCTGIQEILNRRAD